ncbi:Mn-dependent DtxR family transcriptional regulator [Methanohalophilus levihalophilus]|uniref:metal-dependent transcriptional regulator n=1 Tax=Methanohalophilus levihalophilus TaxID=1431282 RepID=UPI001AE1B233|nr:metal-dependent transcriptional regulator [Methanohalophilus levihalophilus]MBP2030142.1 Mn-dependent DtxR family transcriptional regulator [Methanohalophilus levihalophilus]
MEEITGLELSPRKIDYVKYLYQKDARVRTNEISEHFKVDPSTITKTIAELSSSGYADHTPYRGVRLTERGKEYATFLIHRHRILSLMLKQHGLDDENACTEASRFEGYVSKEAVDRICSSMGHPTMGVCGEIEHGSCDLNH